MRITKILHIGGIVAVVWGVLDAPDRAMVRADQIGSTVLDQGDPSISQHQPEFRPLIDMPPDEGFVTQLLLMRAHLHVGMALFEAGVPAQAIAHCSHPLEELYDDLALQLDDRGLPAFGADLRAVIDALRSGTPRAGVASAAEKAALSIDAAIASVDRAASGAPNFIATVATGLLRAAESDYEASLVDGKIMNVIEYQDSRAFLEQARMLVDAERESLEAKDAIAFSEFRKQLDDLDRLVPPLPPTDATNVGVGRVAAIVDRVNELRQNFQ